MSSSRSAGVGSGSVGRLSFRRSPASAEAIGQGAGGSCRWRWWRGTERQRGRGSREAEQGNPPRCSFATLLVRHATRSPRCLFASAFPFSSFFSGFTLFLSPPHATFVLSLTSCQRESQHLLETHYGCGWILARSLLVLGCFPMRSAR